MPLPVKEIELKGLVSALEEAAAQSRVPLILDEAGNADRFLAYQSTTTIEAKQVLMENLKGGKSVADVQEELRQKLVAAMKHGNYLLLRMTNSAVELKGKFAGPGTFPAELLFEPARFAAKDAYMAVVRKPDEDGTGVFVIRPGFQVVVTSSFAVEDYEEFLAGAIPLEKCTVFHVKQQ